MRRTTGTPSFSSSSVHPHPRPRYSVSGNVPERPIHVLRQATFFSARSLEIPDRMVTTIRVHNWGVDRATSRHFEQTEQSILGLGMPNSLSGCSKE